MIGEWQQICISTAPQGIKSIWVMNQLGQSVHQNAIENMIQRKSIQ